MVDLTSEPVSLADIKRQLNMQFDADGAYEFNDDDTLLTRYNTAARSRIENYTGLSLAPKTLRTIVRNELGGVEIPYGPVIAVTAMEYEDGTDLAITDYAIRGNQFKTIETPYRCYLRVTYTAGYTVIPPELAQAIIEQVVFMYKNRGDQQQEYAAADVTLCKSALEWAAPYKRKSFLV